MQQKGCSIDSYLQHIPMHKSPFHVLACHNKLDDIIKSFRQHDIGDMKKSFRQHDISDNDKKFQAA